LKRIIITNTTAMKKIASLLIATGIICQVSGMPSDEKTTGEKALSITLPRIGSGNPSLMETQRYFDKHDNRNHRNWDQENNEDEHDYNARQFRGHLAGIEFGFNNFGYQRDMVLPDQISYMTLNASSSNCFNINFSQLNLGFSRHMGIVSGIGLNWNNYRFEYNNSIGVGPEFITEVSPVTGVPVKKSKFSVLYLNVPVLLEVQLPAGISGHLNVAAGVIGGIKINAWTKVVYEDKEKSRINGDYNLNLLRGGVTARVGYGNLAIFGTYYLTPWFQDLKGPEGLNLEPFEIGIAFTFNN
jgi:hypothetical protein